MGIQLKNNAVGYLATAISASDTGAVLQTGNGAIFPTLGAGDYFYATLESTGGTMEIVKVTARSGDSLGIVRAQEDTTAQSFAVGSRFELRITVASIIDLLIDFTTATPQRFSGNNSTLSVTLSITPTNKSIILVFINGVYQQRDTYTISGATLTFAQAPPLGTDNIEIITLGI